jgi:Protein of unknown function DUF2625
VRPLDELLETNEPGIRLIELWAAAADNHCEILSPSASRGDVLLDLQVTTRSTLGAVAYETGGLLVDHGWLRFLGSGHTKLPRSLTDWNRDRSNGFLLIADDAVSGFFAINGGALGDRMQNVYYWSPDGLEWEDLGIGYTQFLEWSLSSRLADFYTDLRWPAWQADTVQLAGDRCFAFYPFLWTEEGSITGSDRQPVPIAEAFDLKVDILRRLQQSPTGRAADPEQDRDR